MKNLKLKLKKLFNKLSFKKNKELISKARVSGLEALKPTTRKEFNTLRNEDPIKKNTKKEISKK